MPKWGGGDIWPILSAMKIHDKHFKMLELAFDSTTTVRQVRKLVACLEVRCEELCCVFQKGGSSSRRGHWMRRKREEGLLAATDSKLAGTLHTLSQHSTAPLLSPQLPLQQPLSPPPHWQIDNRSHLLFQITTLTTHQLNLNETTTQPQPP